ncbi:MAG: LysM peptidoglycan-binding domain-containing protein [Thermoanaerobaculales bacterium]|nr:LysM peptidoglycan-binding domain-containing protein [Thermoanaerobaculales bacterium]
MKITVSVTIAVMTLVPLVVAAQSVAPPPQPLHLVGDHWTPYDPPSDFPEGTQVHIVEKGNTLWDLARTYLGDPYLWPQIWERNPYIRDSHWIYPGDPIVIDLAVVEPEPIEVEVVEEEFDVSEITDEFEDSGHVGVPYPLASSADIYCFAILVEDESIFQYKIASAERIQFQDHYSVGNVVYVNAGAEQNMRAGDRFFVYHRERKLVHPISRSKMGYIYERVGQLKILCAQEGTSIAEITFACDFIGIGDVLLPFRPIPVPLVLDAEPTDQCDPPTGKPTGYVIHSKDRVIESGTGQVVMIDLTEAEGVYPGQFATVFRDNPVEGMPRLLVGELGILTVEENYSTAIVHDSWTPVFIGDRLELK